MHLFLIHDISIQIMCRLHVKYLELKHLVYFVQRRHALAACWQANKVDQRLTSPRGIFLPSFLSLSAAQPLFLHIINIQAPSVVRRRFVCRQLFFFFLEFIIIVADRRFNDEINHWTPTISTRMNTLINHYELCQ